MMASWTDAGGVLVAARGKHFCRHAGCSELVAQGQYCAKHAPLHTRRFDGRKNAAERGYDARWAKFAHWYLSAPEHQFCALRISPFCKGRAECVDHIRPLTGPDDPARFDPDNLQPACLACNTLKGARTMRGRYSGAEL